MKRVCLISIASLAALLCTTFGAAGAGAAPADLDRSFAGDGIAEVGAFARESGARLAVGSDDSVFVLYSNHPPCEPPFECPVDLGIARFDRDGARDSSYGTGAGSLLQVRQFTERTAFDFAVGPEGRAAVAAYDQN